MSSGSDEATETGGPPDIIDLDSSDPQRPGTSRELEPGSGPSSENGTDVEPDEVIKVGDDHSIVVKRGSTKPGVLSKPVRDLDLNESVFFVFNYMEKTEEKTLVRYFGRIGWGRVTSFDVFF